MNLELSRKHLIILIFSLVVIVLLAVGSYYLYIVPVQNNLELKKSELKTSTQELSIIRNKLKQASDQTVESTMELQEKVPVKRLQDQLLLNIEKAEIVSDSVITNMKLNGTESDEDELATTETTTTNNQNTQTDTDEKTENSSQQDITLPNGMRKTSILITGEAKTYFEMEKFLTELTSLSRIIKIDQLKFTGREEIYSVDQATEPLKFEVTISAYYYPSLLDLQKEIPPLDTPDVSNKKNPLSEFSEVEGNGENDENSTP
ncbi:pilus assembly protein PilO [Neobacillus jeddahensis]|uniref:pilus assembly protein PilO n=1 Tax=Neobacillus jeddahensis TaxID=1461580 RepID=UPI00058FE6FA|nr:pilus assembly protein PilO [Neobacillus jeddahensis]